MGRFDPGWLCVIGMLELAHAEHANIVASAPERSLWESIAGLGILCFAMLIGAFAAGMLPLYLTLSQKQLDLSNALATGLMTGTA